MTFLKRIGEIILKGAQIAGIFAPTIEAALPGQAAKVQVISQDLAQLANIVIAGEAFGQAAGLAGADKAKFIAGQIAQVLLQSAPFSGKKIANPAKFQLDAQALGGVIADLLNDVHPDAVKTLDVPS